jgi:hypothetical protein
MTSRFDFISIGEATFGSADLSFCGEIFVYYNTSEDWFAKEFKGILTDHGDKYRGRWESGGDFDRLVRIFMEDPRLVEVARECIKRRLNYWRDRHA